MASILAQLTEGAMRFTSPVSKLTGFLMGCWGNVNQILYEVPFVYGRLQYIPYSNKIHFVFNTNKLENIMDNYAVNETLKKHERFILDPSCPEYTSLVPIFVKIIQALSDGLRFQKDCKVSVRLPDNYNKQIEGGSCDQFTLETLIPARFSRKRDHEISSVTKFHLKHNTEHLDGLNWKLMLTDSRDGGSASYDPNGNILFYKNHIGAHRSLDEIAFTLAHEVAHGVAQHYQGESFVGFCVGLIKCPGVLVPAILRMWDFFLYMNRRSEFEADHIGLLLMASAGYDPRCVPGYMMNQVDKMDHYMLSVIHPSWEERAKALSRAQVMDKAVNIYKEVQAGKTVRSFISQ